MRKNFDLVQSIKYYMTIILELRNNIWIFESVIETINYEIFQR